ncbi:short-chain dehydrogenase [Amycolatopsis mediterranei S699]|uniref:Short-chain dehydrogenase n=1 Tax=Amycolatopsis mediterranei (strain U-32) TaxID=749927 RepID=A0A0H3CWX8_AMYMU|nr:short-chain dehydrogenase [Amycolatopsis mediterranei U32]AFO74870.1 short-chain dehydrogenase [Amycolatopsis mediterranei S699]AGT81999.1 short-chain dehydrogenase [Amycolatopsis mediterranei RB]KDO05067.1 short-chain dehydrogenase [Amycolatopsis mediterranei]KDU90197.1 short-chain dehydrogenase [Amycolatopsis mediterranei]
MPKVLAVLGVGPGLGLSIAHRFGREGFTTALVSRTDARHADYRASLAGITAPTYTADVTDEAQLGAVLARITADAGEIDTVYFGPADATAGGGITPLTEAGAGSLRAAFDSLVVPAAKLVGAVLPGLLARGSGSLLFAGGLSGKYPMPMLGSLAPASAALRMYVLTLHAALRETGVHAGILTIGGLVERGDIHRMMTAQDHGFTVGTLDPDDIAEKAWSLYVQRDAEAEFTTTAAVQAR